ncbi:CD3324 family protein [Cohnella lubricantis]|uniref:CD3324 family protein n=1 Tax=Cohnella lubricantis TaxID=2163172 RepID=UPI002892D6C4|nr:CD3324 family protein [Cohnella lubricantis]MBP2119644.1 Mor family transcriptional regulator [Cohnella lubricantis]
MEYKNGKDVLPPSLLKELQKYVCGEMVYVPKASDNRVPWGEASGTRKLLAERNREICRLYADGWTVAELESKFHLSVVSIRKIIGASRRQADCGEAHGACGAQEACDESGENEYEERARSYAYH